MIKVKFLQPFKDGIVSSKQFKVGDEFEVTESQYKYIMGSSRVAVVAVIGSDPEPKKAEKPNGKA